MREPGRFIPQDKKLYRVKRVRGFPTTHPRQIGRVGTAWSPRPTTAFWRVLWDDGKVPVFVRFDHLEILFADD